MKSDSVQVVFYQHFLVILQVPFVAINCWHANSQCKSKYKFYSYPSFYVYAAGMDLGFTYTGRW